LWSPQQEALAENEWSVDQILDFAECAASAPEGRPRFCAGMPYDPIAPVIQKDKEIAVARGLRLLGYEGGQHMLAVNGHAAFVDKLAAVNRAPRMKQVYAKYLDTWRRAGGELMFLVSFVQGYGRFGYWGMLERQDEPVADAPKLGASLEFIARQPRWWTDPWPPVEAPSPSARPAEAHPVHTNKLSQ
jgi:hypothetical protein